MDRCDVVGDLVDTGIVAGIKANQKVGIINIWQVFKNFGQDSRS